MVIYAYQNNNIFSLILTANKHHWNKKTKETQKIQNPHDSKSNFLGFMSSVSKLLESPMEMVAMSWCSASKWGSKIGDIVVL